MPFDNLSNGTALWVDVVWSKERPLGLGAARFVALMRESATHAPRHPAGHRNYLNEIWDPSLIHQAPLAIFSIAKIAGGSGFTGSNTTPGGRRAWQSRPQACARWQACTNAFRHATGQTPGPPGRNPVFPHTRSLYARHHPFTPRQGALAQRWRTGNLGLYARREVRQGQALYPRTSDPGDKPFHRRQVRRQGRGRNAGRGTRRAAEPFYADRRLKLLVVLQGTDTSGKGRHHPRRVWPDERFRRTPWAGRRPPKPNAHDYLWRIHQQVPQAATSPCSTAATTRMCWCPWSTAGSRPRSTSSAWPISTTSSAC